MASVAEYGECGVELSVVSVASVAECGGLAECDECGGVWRSVWRSEAKCGGVWLLWQVWRNMANVEWS